MSSKEILSMVLMDNGAPNPTSGERPRGMMDSGEAQSMSQGDAVSSPDKGLECETMVMEETRMDGETSCGMPQGAPPDTPSVSRASSFRSEASGSQMKRPRSRSSGAQDSSDTERDQMRKKKAGQGAGADDPKADGEGAFLRQDFVLTHAKGLEKEIRRICMDPARKITKDTGVEITDRVADIIALLSTAIVANAKADGRCRALRLTVKSAMSGVESRVERTVKRVLETSLQGLSAEQANVVPPREEDPQQRTDSRTYLEVLGGGSRAPPVARQKATVVPVAKPKQRPKVHSVVLYPSGEQEKDVVDSAQTRQRLQDIVHPLDDGISVKAVRSIPNRGVVVETFSQEDKARLLNHPGLSPGGLRAAEPEKRHRVLMYDVPRTDTDADVWKCIARTFPEGLSPEVVDEMKKEMKLVFRLGDRKKPECHWVIEVSPRCREAILSYGRVPLLWTSCRVRDYADVSRCFKCQGYNHVAKFCKKAVPTCGHCGESGHQNKDCPKTGEKAVCVNCRRAGLSFEHSARSKVCPSWKMASEERQNRAHYG